MSIAGSRAGPERWPGHTSIVCTILALSLLVSSCLSGCSYNAADLEYAPQPGQDWATSSPAEQGLDPDLVDALYRDAADLDTLFGVLVVKHGYLVAEKYYNGGSIEQTALLQSVSKSITSALVGIALEEGCLDSVDQEMLDYFPEQALRVQDARKAQITLRQMLQMRAGYPDEETDAALLDALYWGEYLPLVVDFALVSDPGADFHYSNLTSNWLGIILQRTCAPDLPDYAQEHLFGPMGVQVGDWVRDRDGYHIGCGGVHLRARDAARFGELYLDDGVYEGQQIVPAEWVRASLQSYSPNARDYGPSVRFRHMGYGYQWWSTQVGEHRLNFAWGHGGQFIVLLQDLDMVIVTTAEPFVGEHSGDSWKHEKAIMNMIGDFVASLPHD